MYTSIGARICWILEIGHRLMMAGDTLLNYIEI